MELLTKPVETTDAAFAAFVKQHPNVAVYFWAPWCVPCKRVGPVMDELAGEFGGSVVVAKVNGDENPQTMTRHNVMGLPTILLVRNGQVVDRLTGAVAKDAVKARYKSAFGV